jgi:pimeloyl-ACP methyl ester carboxylesterase
MTEKARSGRIPVPGGELAYDEAGEGAPIVFLHAAIADRRMWDREYREYAAGHRVVRYDLRGLGQSPAATAPFSWHEDLRAVLDHLHVEQPILVGTSNGGRTVLDFALAYPGRARALLLVAPGVSGIDTDMMPEGNADFESDGKRSGAIVEEWTNGHRAEALRGLQQYWCGSATGAAAELVGRMMAENAEEIFTDKSAAHATRLQPPAAGRLAEIRVPTTILLGDKDEPTSGHIGRFIGKGIPGAKVVPVPGGDHLINLSRPEAFDRALRALAE